MQHYRCNLQAVAGSVGVYPGPRLNLGHTMMPSQSVGASHA